MAETQTLNHLILFIVMLLLTMNIGMAYNVGTNTEHNPGNIKDRVVYLVHFLFTYGFIINYDFIFIYGFIVNYDFIFILVQCIKLQR